MGFKNRETRSVSDHKTHEAFIEILSRLNAESTSDVDFAEALFGITLSGPLRSLLSHRVGEQDVELRAWMGLTVAETYPHEKKEFESKPFELVLGESWWIHGLFCDAIPIGSDSAGQIYYARLQEPHEVSLYDPGQGAVRFIARDLPTFAYLACLSQRAYDLIEELELDDPEDADPSAPEFRELRRDLKSIAGDICLTDDIVATDFDDVLTGLTGLQPSHRPTVIPTERLHDRAEWLICVLAMGYDSVPIDNIPDTYLVEKNSDEWSSPAVRLYWLWHAFLLDEATRLDELIADLQADPALLVRDSVRIILQLHNLTKTSAAPERLQDVLRSRLTLRKLWHQQAVPGLHSEKPFAPQHERRLKFIATKAHAREKELYVEEPRESVAAIRHSGPSVCAPLLAHLDHPPAGGQFDPRFNPTGADLFPYQPDPMAKNALLAALDVRSSNNLPLPGIVRALGRLQACECHPKLVSLLDEFAPVWEGSYAKAGNPEIVEAVCEALSIIPTNTAIDTLLELANKDTRVEASFNIRSLAVIALAHTDWVAPPEQLQAWLDGDTRTATLYHMALHGHAVPIDPDIEITPTTCVTYLCAAVAGGDFLAGVQAAKLALQTLYSCPLETELAHRMALDLLAEALPYNEVCALLRRIVLFARDEDIRHHALLLIRHHEPDFVLTFCDRPTVDIAFQERGEAGLVDLLSACNPVFAHNVFAKAAEMNMSDAVVPFLQPFAVGLSQYLHFTDIPYSIESQYYAEIACLQAVGEPRVCEAIETLWQSGRVGESRVEYVLQDRSYREMETFQARVSERDLLANKIGAAYAAGKYDEASELGEALVKEFSRNAPAHRNLGHANLMSGNFSDAFTAYRQAQHVDPDNVMGWYWVSQASYHKEEWSEVIQYARLGLSIDQDSQRCRFNLALGLQHKGQMREALTELERLAKADIGEAWMIPSIYINRAEILAQLGELELAREALKACFAAKPDYLKIALAMDGLVETLGEKMINGCANTV